ncbi:YdeI/OmpD-associated family protein [Flavobacterium sp.]|uniref:YdeI/OmpD-associated family protein n=1 Tax=Flavobacterium sp. TaxID=239 RepID=UPI0039E3E872
MEKEKKNWNSNDLWEKEIEMLKDIVAQTELVETVKWGGIVYTVGNKNVLGIGGFKNFFTLWFFNGVFLTDPKKVLVNANEGVTKSLRQWRFSSIDEIDEKAILLYVNEAITNEKAGKSIKPEAKSKNFEVPEILILALKEAKLESRFFEFTPFKQREFSEYISEAKQEKTKRTRIEKILPMIKDGIGLNDKYR